MTLPASGTISMSQVSTELGRASNAQTSLGETAVRNLAGVASGAIAFSNLHGKSAFSIVGTTPSVTASDYDIGASLAQLNLNSDGSMTNQDSTNLGNWGTPVSAGAGSGKYVKWRRNTGTLPSVSSGFTENTWVSMTGLRYLYHSTTGNQFKTCTVYIQFADNSSGGGASTEGLCSIEATSEI